MFRVVFDRKYGGILVIFISISGRIRYCLCFMCVWCGFCFFIIVTVSLSRDFSKIRMCSSSLMWIFSKTVSIVTGFTAEMMLLKSRVFSRLMLLICSSFIRYTAYRRLFRKNVFYSVFIIVKIRMVFRFFVNCRRGRK